MIHRRVSAGSMTSSISKCDAVFSALPCSYIRSTMLLEQRLALGRVVDRLQLLAVAEAHRALQAHAAELAGRPGDARQRRLGAAAHHRLGAEPVALAQHDADHRHGDVGAGDEQPAAVAHERGLLDRRARPSSRACRTA